MKLFFVSKRYMALLFLFFQFLASVSVAETERISILDWVSLSFPRPPKLASKFNSLGAPSAGNVAAVQRYVNAQGADSEMEKLVAVNAWVNEKINFTDDSDDQWLDTNRTLARGKGDCEDHAITKMQLLRSIGFDQDQILFLIVKDLILRQDHAVLAVLIEGEYYILDNVTDSVFSHRKFIGSFNPLLAFRGNQTWTFGRLVQKDQE